ncbi:heptahelical protein 4, partial [Prunus dulcis]
SSMKEDLANIVAPLMLRPITRWPFFAFLGGAMFCLLSSSACHLLSCHSERMSYIMLRLDYAGIAALISTSFYPLSTTPSCHGMSGILPVMHKLVLFSDQPEALHTTGYEILMGALYGVGALVYATRFQNDGCLGNSTLQGIATNVSHISSGRRLKTEVGVV